MGDANLPDDVADYIGTPLPNWQVGEMECTQKGNEVVQQTGAWLIHSGTITPQSKIKWEIVSDQVHRDVDSAFFLTTGISQALQRKYGETVESIGTQDIHVDTRFSEPDFCQPTENDEDWAKEVERRLTNLPRPELSFYDALLLVEKIMGYGRAGKPANILSTEPELNHDNWELTGAALFLDRIGAMLFASRAGGIVDPPFAPLATKEQVFQLLQFHHWYRSVRHAGNDYEATSGGIQVQTLIQVLRQGYFQQDPSSQGDEEDYDTTVTIVFGHDGDLDCMATALGATWVLQEPYISGPQGAFLPTPPMSGIHAVRDVTTDRVDLSFVYPVYPNHMYATGPNFALDTAGQLQSTPLLFDQAVPFTQVQDTTTSIQSPKDSSKTSLDILEDHVLEILAGYSERSEECYHKAVDYWGAGVETSCSQASSLESITNNNLLAFALVCLSSTAGILLLFTWKRQKHHPLGRKTLFGKRESLPETVLDDTVPGDDDDDDDDDTNDEMQSTAIRRDGEVRTAAPRNSATFIRAPSFFT